ncbi:MAG: tricarboxylate transporter, partial [Betaproteobacteria bacterium]|nr:tricarboxylate transporter [Betaproteobacteria bacterium]
MKSNSLLKRAACVGIVAGLAGLPSMDAVAQPVDFADKRVELIVPFAPGGGADTYARALAPHLEKHLPGHPTIIVRNIP